MPNGHPAWSPDGKTIAIPTEMGLALLTPGGATPQRTLLQGRFVEAVQWSADGNTLYVPGRRAEGSQLEVIDVATGTSRVVATLPPGVIIAASGIPMQRLSWNVEGTALLTTVVRDQNTDLWILEGFRAPATGWRRWFGWR
jgi:Tol biopolymer transport system component